MSYLALQIGLAAALLVATAVAGIFPLILLTVLRRKGKDHTQAGWLSYLACFSGGVFLATCFLDVIPHINESYEELLKNYSLKTEFPYTQLIICCGFFLVYFVEEFTTLVFGHSGHGHSHTGAPSTAQPGGNNKDNVTNGSSFGRREEKTLRDNLVTKDLDDDDGLFKSPEVALSLHSLVIEGTASWVVSDDKSNLLKSITFAVAMSFHSLLEGFALGVQDTKTGILALFFSLLLHKSIEAFSVGLQISRANSSKYKTVAATIFIYSLMTPIGSILGTILQNSAAQSLTKDGSMLILECLAAGTFIYVTFIEVLAHEKDNDFNNLKQLLSIIAGFLLITALQVFFSHEHDELVGSPIVNSTGI